MSINDISSKQPDDVELEDAFRQAKERVYASKQIERLRLQGLFPDAEGNLRNHKGQVVVQQTDAPDWSAADMDNRWNEKLLGLIREKLESIVVTKGEDAGLVLLSQDGPTHPEKHGGETIQVYDHEYFSPLGDALIELYKIAGGSVE